MKGFFCGLLLWYMWDRFSDVCLNHHVHIAILFLQWLLFQLKSYSVRHHHVIRFLDIKQLSLLNTNYVDNTRTKRKQILLRVIGKKRREKSSAWYLSVDVPAEARSDKDRFSLRTYSLNYWMPHLFKKCIISKIHLPKIDAILIFFIVIPLLAITSVILAFIEVLL